MEVGRQISRKDFFSKVRKVIRKKKFSVSSLSNVDEQDGIEKVLISPYTQSIIGCKIGQDITPDRIWIFVEKKKIEDDLDKYKTTSEFYPVEKKIRKYPEAEILLGSDSCNVCDQVEFLLCLTVKAKEKTQQLIKKQYDSLLVKILECINRKARPWISLGSEAEVVGNMNRNNRCLMVVELQPLYPIIKVKTKFKICSANSYNGYVEILPSSRVPINSVMRKLVDRSTQSIPLKLNKKQQVFIINVAHKYTQYSFELPEAQSFVSAERFVEFVSSIFGGLSDKLIVNSVLNIFADDYNTLIKKPIGTNMFFPTEVSCHQDIMTCKDKRVSAVSWNGLISGVVAAAYVKQPGFCLTTQNLENQHSVSDCLAEVYYVLLWTYKTTLRPKLYLHAVREVTCLSFCPYNEYILVGGCSNGQILVWDLSNKLFFSEIRRGRTSAEYHMHMIVQNLTSWMKSSPGDNHLYPVIISSLDTGHNTPITSIVWIPPCHHLSKQGKYKITSEEKPHMQILTSSMSGSQILVYDLMAEEGKSLKKDKTSRLSRLPTGLRGMKPILTEMRHNFDPIYILKIKNPYTKQTFPPIMKILTRNDRYTYQCENPETENDPDKMTYFKMLELLHPFDRTMNLMCSTGSGTLQIVSWDGQDFDQGQNVSKEQCRINSLGVVHDGPILVCEANPFFPEILLTIGGTVLAIWNISEMQSPLLWRKAKCKYCSGMWSYIHPLVLVMIRTDTYYEYWNFSVISHGPITCFKHKGTMLIMLYSDSRKYHVRKKTYIAIDDVGALKVLKIPSWEKSETDPSEVTESRDYLNRILEIKLYIENLKMKVVKDSEKVPILKEQVDKSATEDAPPIETHRKSSKKHGKKSHIEKWKELQIKEETHMRNTLLEKKHIRLEDVEKSIKPIVNKAKSKRFQRKKILETLAKREDPVEKILKSISTTLKVRRTVEVSYPKEKTLDMKEQYKESYNKLEKSILENILAKPYRFKFDWKLFLNKRNPRGDICTGLMAKYIGNAAFC